MASQLDGEIAFDWQPVGLRAVLRFPVGDASAVPDAATPAPDRAVGQQSASLSGKRVLVVEDAALVAAETQEALTAAGADVVGPALSLDAALRLAASESLDAAVLDVHLGDVAVFPVADALARRGVPFVFLTGYADAYAWPAAHADVPRVAKPAQQGQIIEALGIVMASASAAAGRAASA